MARSYSNLSTYDKMGRLFKMTKGTKTYGEAHFEDPEEYKTVAVVQREEDSVGTILGQLDESGKYPIVFREDKENRLNRHIAIVGASGSGKTYTFSKNYVFQAVKRRESVSSRTRMAACLQIWQAISRTEAISSGGSTWLIWTRVTVGTA